MTEKIYAEIGKHTTDLYFEAHVTIDPVGDPLRQEWLNTIANNHVFRVAEFLFKKTHATAYPDDFLTTRSESYDVIASRVLSLIDVLDREGFIVRRYKIENTLVDVRI